MIEHRYIKNGTVNVSAEILNGDALPIKLPDLHIQDIGKKSNGTIDGEVVRTILGPIIRQIGTALASIGVNTAGKTIRKGVEAATETIKQLLK